MIKENKTWLGRVFAAIASIFINNYADWLRKLWSNIADELKPDLVQVVEIIEKVKAYANHPAVDLITFAIPGDKDDKSVAWLRTILNSVLLELNLDDEKVNADLSKTDLQSLATRMTEEVTGLPFDQASTTIKTAYWNTVKLV